MTIVKRCACGRTYTLAEWEALPDKKVYTLEWREVHDQRQCPCGSHIIRILEPGEPGPKRGQHWYSRATGKTIVIASIMLGHPAFVVYRSGGPRRITLGLAEFFARFTRTAPA